MTMITTASPPRLAGGDEGQALQRRQLLDMERQWLNSWTQADQLAADAKPDGVEAATRKGQAATRESTASAAALQGLAALPAQTQAPSGTPSPAPLQTVDAAPSPALQHESGAALSAWAAAGGQPGEATPSQGRPQEPAPGAVRATTHDARPVQGLSPASVSPGPGVAFMSAEAVHVSVAEPAVSMERMPLMVRPWSATAAIDTPAPVSSTALSRTEALQPPTAAAPGAAAQGAMQEGDAGASEGAAEASGTKHKARPAASAQPGSDSSPQDRQRITLHELDAATVQATLRDAQLTAQASELAARGLHHALMEAGYARVRVVVNGHAVKPDPAARDSSAQDASHERIAPAGLRRKT